MGDELLNYLKVKSQAAEQDPVTRLNMGLADMCLKLLVNDLDGQAILDYLGAEMKKGLAEQVAPGIVEKAKAFVLEASEKHQWERNTKLAIRYSMLRSYFASRLSLWQGDLPSSGKSELSDKTAEETGT